MTHLPDAAPASAGTPAGMERQALLKALPQALAQGELSLAYQPQLCLTSGAVLGAEALLRWHLPGVGDVPPAVFVPLAEEAGLIAEFGRWALHAACVQAMAWRDAGLPPVRMSVNVSPLQFREGDVAELARQALRAAGLPAHALGIEVTESTLLHDSGQVSCALRELQAMGVEISIDDFGTGYSSLARLRDLPLDVVKIDRSFIHDVTTAASHASITRSVIHLAHGLHLRVLAEGVETEEQLRMLVDNGCDRIQGWVFGAAIDGVAFGALLRSGKHLPKQLTHRREHQRTLLLVDDEEHIVTALKRLFRRDDYRILTAHSGAEGLKLLQQHAVDVIISDQRMPGMTGVDFLRRAKELHPDSVRMTLSGYTEMQSIIDAVNEGAVYKFLTKPWDDNRLREHVALAFRERELAAENRRLQAEITATNTELAEANRRLQHLVAAEHERVAAMQVAAGGARDMVSVMPAAVFGIDAEGCLAYVNRRAVRDWPAWAADIGSTPVQEMQHLLQALPDAEDAPCHCVTLAGQQVLVWAPRVQGDNVVLGRLLILQPAACVEDDDRVLLGA